MTIRIGMSKPEKTPNHLDVFSNPVIIPSKANAERNHRSLFSEIPASTK
jgi:hypothetical protein